MGEVATWILFTFHYGSILISFATNVYAYTASFTFHYGSILIQGKSRVHNRAVIFTFHYGSILIYKINTSNSNNPIYIPLWFYSNETSNSQNGKTVKFTFHYDSILIYNEE